MLSIGITKSFVDVCHAREKFIERQSDHGNLFDAFIEHATRSVPFYKILNLAPENYFHNDFPLITRSELGNLNTALSKKFLKRELTFRTTSGTSGMPLTIGRDKASLYAFLHLGFRKVIDQACPSQLKFLKPGKLGILLIDDLASTTMLRNLNPALNFCEIRRQSISQDSSNDLSFIKELRMTNIPILYGRPRVINRLQQLDSMLGGPRIKPRVILMSGDNLYSDVRTRIQRWFNCPVINIYAMQECGFIGSDCAHECGMHIFEDSCDIKVVDERGAISDTGEGFAMVTCCDNWAHPIINYRTDDHVRLVRETCACGYAGKTISEIKGRNSPYFFFEGKPFNPSLFNKVFENHQLKQFQLIQRGDHFTLNLVPFLADTDEMTLQIKKELMSIAPIKDMAINVCEFIDADSEKKIQRYIYQKS